MWMTTQEPPFMMPLTGSQKPPVFVNETGTFHRNVIGRNLDQQVTGCNSHSERFGEFLTIKP